MCPSYMATRDEADSTRGRANVLRLAMAGRLGEAGLGDDGVYEVLDLCLECRACKAECPVGVDMARFKSEFLADYWSRHGVSLHARVLGHARTLAKWGSRLRAAVQLDHEQRRGQARWARNGSASIAAALCPRSPGARWRSWRPRAMPGATPSLFNDTFTNYYEPEIGMAVLDVLRAAGVRAGLARHGCCGRPQISKGLLGEARTLAARNADALLSARRGRPEDRVLRAELPVGRARGCAVAAARGGPEEGRGASRRRACCSRSSARRVIGNLPLKPGPPKSCCTATAIRSRWGCSRRPGRCSRASPAPPSSISTPAAAAWRDRSAMRPRHFDVSRAIGERKLLPAVRDRKPGTVVVAAGTSCRHQVKDFTGERAVHPAVLLRSLLDG